MRWESKVLSPNQMLSSCLCFFKIIPSPSWIFVLPAALISLVFATYLVPGFGFFSVFLYTSLVLVLSTFFCSSTTLNLHKTACVVGETESSMEESSDPREDIAEKKEEEEEEEEEEKEDDDNNGDKEKTSYYAEESSDQREDISEAKEEEVEHNNGGGSGVNNNNYPTRSPDSLSNSRSHLQEMSTSMEYDELDDYRPLYQSIDSSDGSISDEESLIEIALPTGHCSLKHLQQQQHSLTMMTELLAEYNFDMNEEDNLIEIDISMGSIKSYPSRFEIQA
ncbi:hypothetical protein QN277_019362 [Acacia crassicarpa]|uniref:Uncharacterized protein n=1 Tax=Acacia crassicarpa TaxID=499986 RepID=A0AAE1MV52_9FABA|nr:hypothetical protein QN277_019362 [Acacia crassicarpa]